MIQRLREHLTPVIATVLSAAPVFATAQAETVTGYGVSGGIEYASNPFLLTSSDTSAIRGRVSISPYIEERMARSSLRVASDASFSVYDRRYRETIDLASNISYRNSLTSRLAVNAGVSLSSSVGGIYNLVPVFATPATPTPPIVPQIIDITIVGFQDRTVQAQASAGGNYVIDDKNSVSLNLDGAVVRYPTAINRAEYSTVRQSSSYSRTLNSRASVGASLSLTRIDYRGGPAGDAFIISPSINGSLRISPQWTLGAGIGLSSSRLNIGFGKITSNDLSGNFSACRTGPRSNFCVNGARSTAASSFDGLRTTTTFGASNSYRLSARDTFSIAGSYSKSTVPQQFVGGLGSIDYLSGTTSWSRRFTERLSGNVTAGFSRSGFQGTRNNTYGAIGVNYSFGRQ